MLFQKSFRKTCQLLLLLLLAAACSSKVEKATDSANATFFVDSINGSSVVSKVDPNYAIPKARLYNFKTCLKDILQAKSIIGQSFKIDGGDTQKIISSDEQGCLNWSETIEYNFLSQSSFIKMRRKISANGIHKGSSEIELILNPWSHGEEATGVIDPSKNSISSPVTEVSSLHEISSINALESRSPLWAIAPRVTVLQNEFNSNGASMLLKFQTKLSVVLLSSTLQKNQYPINSGKFNFEMFLYNSIIDNGVEKIIPIANSIQKEISFNQETLIAEFPFNLTLLPNKGSILMGMRISPSGNDIGLEPFEGVFMLSDNANIKVDSTPSLMPNLSFSQLVQKMENKVAENKKAIEQVKPGLEIEKLDIKFFKMGSESTTDRQVFFTVKACLKNNLDGHQMRDEVFMIKTISDKKGLSLKSDQGGCVSWDDFIWHKFFGKEHFIKSSINISSGTYSLNENISIVLNPWDTGSNFARDGRFVEDLGSLNINPSNEKPQISINNYGFSVSGYGYDINNNLDLSLIKNGTLSLSAKVINHSSLASGRMGSDSLRDGQYLLKWAVVTTDADQKFDSLISNGQKIVSVVGGDINTNVGFKVSAFEKLNLRSRLIVGLYTVNDDKLKKGIIEIDRASGLEATPHMATIILNNDQDSQKMQILNNNLSLGNGDVFDLIASKTPKTTTDFTGQFLKGQNIAKINLAIEKESQFLRDGLANPNKYITLTQNPSYYHEANQKPVISSTSLIEFAKTGKLSAELSMKFCAFWFSDYIERVSGDSKNSAILSDMKPVLIQSCIETSRRDPSRFFSIDKKIMIKKIGDYKYKSGTTTNFSVGNNFNVAKGEAKTKSSSVSWSTRLGLSFDVLSIFKIGTDVSYSLSSTKANSESITNSAQVNASTYLFLQTNTFDLVITSYEECTVIKLNPELFVGKNARFAGVWNTEASAAKIVKVATSGLFLCTGVNNNSPITKQENYYLVSQDTSFNNGQQDGHDLNNRQLFMTFRGQSDLVNFLNLIQSSVKLPGSANSFESSTTGTKTSLVKSFYVLPSWPGAYSDF